MSTYADKIKVTIDGKKIKKYAFSNIQLVQELLKPNELSFCMHKDDLEQDEQNVRYSLTDELLGKSVKLSINTVRENEDKDFVNDTLEFNGIIFSIKIIKKESSAGQIIQVTAYSADYFLMDNPHCISYEATSLKDIVSKTLEPYKIDIINKPTKEDPIPYTVQYNETNYDFLRRIATRYGQWMYHNGEKLVFGEAEKKDCLTLVLGMDFNDYHFQMNMKNLNVTHAHHKYVEYKDIRNFGMDYASDSIHVLADKAYYASEEMFNKETLQNVDVPEPDENFDEAEISSEVDVLGKKSQMFLGTGSTVRADLRVGTVFEVEESFTTDGSKQEMLHDEMRITKITHVSDGDSTYINYFEAVPSHCDLPPYTYFEHFPKAGTQRAVVIDNKDPEKLGRVRVQFFWQKDQDANMITPWIRIAQPHGGTPKGFYFIPEIEEEVMVGFENGNAEKPFVIGTLYHGKAKPEEEWYTDENQVKAIRTKNGHTIEIHDVDDNGYIKIYDHNKENYILTFSTDDKLIKLESTGNIELHAEKNIIMEADENIIMKAGKNIDMEAGEDMNREAGDNINEKAGKDISREAGENVKEVAGENINIQADKNIEILASENITTDSDKSTNIVVGENLEIGVVDDMNMAVKNMAISSDMKFSLEAMEIAQKGNTKVALESGATWEQKASATMKIDGGGMLEAKGGMVKIN